MDLNFYLKDLDTDHYALEKVKRRILEYLAVRQLKNSLKGNFFYYSILLKVYLL